MCVRGGIVINELIGEESFQTFDKLMSTPVDEGGRPRKTLSMRGLRVVDVSPNTASTTTP